MDIVSALQHALADRVGRERYEVWFGSNTRFVIDDERLLVEVPSPFFQDWLRSHFRTHVEDACLRAVGRSLAVMFQVGAAAPVEAQPASALCGEGGRLSQAAAGQSTVVAAAGVRPVGERPRSAAGRHPAALTKATTGRGAHAMPAVDDRNMTSAAGATGEPCEAAPRWQQPAHSFERFVVGTNNRLAYGSAASVVERPGSLSPLLIHGPTGVGKTHLLEAICQAARRRHPGLTAVVVRAEQFTTGFLEALRGSGLPNFRHKYRSAQLLAVDDVQFFAGKRATLVELMQTVDAILRLGRQLVFASDRPPSELSALGAELRTRLEGGLGCAIQPPEFETRLAIARQMSEDFGLAVPEDVLRLVAERFRSHARELAGAVKRLHATSLVWRQPISLELAESALADLVQHEQRPVRLPDIEKAVCDIFGLEPASLQSQVKRRDVSHPRMLAMWLARKHTRAALSEIGQFFGGRSHSTVISAHRKVSAWVNDGTVLRLSQRDLKVDDLLRRVEDRLVAAAG